MENFKCCCPEWLSERERSDLPCGTQESVEDIPCCECCWFMPVSEEFDMPELAAGMIATQ